MPAAHQALLDAIDRIVSTHGDTHPDLVRDLLRIRQDLVDAHRQNHVKDLAQAALRVATLVKFLYDTLF